MSAAGNSLSNTSRRRRASDETPGIGLRRSYLRAVVVAGVVLAGVCVSLCASLGGASGLVVALPSWLWFAVAARWIRGQLSLVRPDDRARPYDRFLLANSMTLFRLLATPMLALGVAQRTGDLRTQWILFGFFIMCATTDVLDGWLARTRNECSIFGRMYDHVTDIIFGTLMSVALWWSGLLPSWFFVLALVRFLLPVFGGGWLFFQQVAWRIEPSVIGKVTVSTLALLALAYLLPEGLVDPTVVDHLVIGLLDLSAFLVGINLVYLVRRGISILGSTEGPRRR
ncbi:MAG: CDP-alcohol phosphatidyltransferase family protein [Pseudomonadota bacterium]